MAEKKTHKVEMTTCQGDRVPPIDVTEDEARKMENLPFVDTSNIAAVRITPK